MKPDNITNVTREEFLRIRGAGTGRPASAEAEALVRLSMGKGIKIPCRWKHAYRSCGGLSIMHVVGKRHGFKVTCACRDGVLYVWKGALEMEE